MMPRTLFLSPFPTIPGLVFQSPWDEHMTIYCKVFPHKQTIYSKNWITLPFARVIYLSVFYDSSHFAKNPFLQDENFSTPLQ